MVKTESLIKKIFLFKKAASKSLKITKMLLFGSVARGSVKKDSDVDLIVVSPEFENLRFNKRNSDLYDYWTLDYPVDFICLSPTEFKRLKNQVSIVSEAIREGIEIN